MEIVLSVGVAAPGEPATFTDVVAHVEPTHTVAELIDRLASTIGLVSAPRVLTRMSTGEVSGPAALLGDVGLLRGERVLLGNPARPPPSRPSGLQLVVCSGPDVGRCRPLSGQHLTVGRDHNCGLALTDPAVARVHAVIGSEVGSEDRFVIGGAEIEGEAHAPPIALDGEPVTTPTIVPIGGLIRIGSSTLAIRAVGPGGRASVAERHLGQVPFHRTPYFSAPIEPVVFEPLGDIPEKPEPTPFAYLAALMPLVLGIALAVLYSPRFLVFAAFTPVIAVAGYIDQRRRVRRRYGRGEERFRARMAERLAAVDAAVRAERHRRFLGGPDLVTLADRAALRSPELWVRHREATDFLTVRLGLGDTDPEVDVRPESRGDEVLLDEMEAAVTAIATMRDVPVPVNLARLGVLGLVGDDRDTTQLTTSLVVQACCLHSPEDLVVVAMVDPVRSMTSWLNWLPHLRSPSSPIAGEHLTTGRSGADRLLKDLLVVVERRLASARQDTGCHSPHVLVLIDQPLDPDPSLVSRLLDLGPEAGLSILWLTGGGDRVPRQASAVVDCRPLLGGKSSVVTHTDPTVEDRALLIERADESVAESIARSLAPLRDASSANSASAVPRAVTLHQALGLDDIDADWVLDQWAVDRGGALPSPIGLSAAGPLVVDLVSNGPHGLIGGTSGAGKSELLTSMVGGLMALNPPSRVNFLFIDYKGGAASDVFAAAPHTVGCVTNLDELLARRALTSLRAELNRRMDLLQGRAKSIGELVAVDPDAAPPSLVIVIDEFATLIKEVPEFMVGIVDIAQRGRSLGIHLILATQRPSGAVNDNILANTNLRISLRMLDGSESTSVIGTPDAAAIPNPLKGRGFARLGPGELIAFQTAWSGAPLLSTGGVDPVVVTPFPAAAGAVTPEPTGAPVPSGATAAAGTQLQGLLTAIGLAAERLRLAPPRSPWLDELPLRVALDDVRTRSSSRGRGRVTGGGTSPYTVTVGLVDVPEDQAQYPASVDFDAGGGLLVFGSGGSGKTTVLRTVAVSAALDDDAGGGATVTIFALDFASRHLTDLVGLPQCGGVATGDDLEAVTRIVTVLEAELDRRRSAVAAAGLDGGDAAPVDRILLLVDDYGAVVEAFEGAGASTTLYPWLERVNRLIVEGRQCGIHAVVTASRPGAVRGAVLSAITNRIVLRQSDTAAYSQLDIPSSLLGDLTLGPGRGFLDLTMGSRHVIGQIAVAVGPDDDDRHDDERNGDWAATGAQQHAVRCLGPTLKGSVATDLVSEPLPSQAPRCRPTGPALTAVIGVADLSLSPVEVDLSVNDLAVFGEPRSGRTTVLATIAEHLVANGTEVWTAGVADSPLADMTTAHRSAFGRPPELKPFFEDLFDALSRRAGARPILIVDDVDLLDDVGLDPILASVVQGGLRLVASSAGIRGYTSSPLVQAMRKARSVLAVGASADHDLQDITGTAIRLRPGLKMGPGRAVLVVNRQATVVQLSPYF